MITPHGRVKVQTLRPIPAPEQQAVSGRGIARDPHCGPVPAEAWRLDAETRRHGRVEMFNALKQDGMEHWTMSLPQYELMRSHILAMIDAGEDGTVLLKNVVAAAQDRYATHELFPSSRVRNYCTFTKVDLEARCEIERIAGRSPQRIGRWRDG